MFIYSIKNEKLSFFNRPIYAESVNEALSYIMNVLMSDADRALIGLRDDLSLYELGEIDFVSGVITAHDAPIEISTLSSIFDMIPQDKLKPALTVENFKKLMEQFSDLKEEFHSLDFENIRHEFNILYSDFYGHSHTKKGVLCTHDS